MEIGGVDRGPGVGDLRFAVTKRMRGEFLTFRTERIRETVVKDGAAKMENWRGMERGGRFEE